MHIYKQQLTKDKPNAAGAGGMERKINSLNQTPRKCNIFGECVIKL
jgi:hypothetical protein